MGEDSFIDKSSWARGQWDHEPDRVEWIDEDTKYPCIALRILTHGAWCGYVGISKNHPYFQKYYDEIDCSAHGGLTYSDLCRENNEELGVCHKSAEKFWWVGFDTAHSGDLSPAYISSSGGIYRDLNYIKEEIRSLAKQLKDKETF